MTLWIAFAVMTLTAVGLLLFPLLRHRPAQAPGRAAYDLTVYKDQLAEVERDVERGLLTPSQAEAARTEIQRRMLATGDRGEARPGIGPRARLAAAAAIALALPLGGMVLYGKLGAPGMPDQPYAERMAQRLNLSPEDTAKMAALLDQLAERMRQNPNDPQGWALLARSYKSMARYDEAADAYRHMIGLGVNDAETQASLGEVIVLGNKGAVMPEARKAFQAAVQADPREPRSRYYLGLARLQIGDAQGAVAIWRDLEKDSPADAPWLPMVQGRIQAAAEQGGFDPATVPPQSPVKPGETAAPMARNQAPSQTPNQAPAAPGMKNFTADQSQMIQGMVANLAAKLEQDPGNFDGWMRLGRAYLVMGDAAKSKEAYGKAAALKPQDVDAKLGLAQALAAAAPADSTTIPAEVTALMREVLAIAPDNPDALYVVGTAEAEAGNSGKARELWGRLRDQIPANSPERAEIEKRLSELK